MFWITFASTLAVVGPIVALALSAYLVGRWHNPFGLVIGVLVVAAALVPSIAWMLTEWHIDQDSTAYVVIALLAGWGVGGGYLASIIYEAARSYSNESHLRVSKRERRKALRSASNVRSYPTMTSRF
jgi:hypothetical protein